MTEKEIENAKRAKLKAEKPAVYEKVIKIKERFELGIPTPIFDIAYNYACNLHCQHCSAARFTKKPHSLDPVTLRAFSDQCDALGLCQFNLSGGEPLILKDIDNVLAALDKLAKAFFADKEVRKYLSDYEETINALFEPKEKPKPAKALTEEEIKERILKGIDKLKEFAFNQAEVIDTLEEPGEVIKLWKSLGLFGDEEEAMEAPRRYLPTMCSECRYKAFCEQECEDLCSLCKYKKYANENGVRYETKEQLINPNKD